MLEMRNMTQEEKIHWDFKEDWKYQNKESVNIHLF